MSDETTRFRVGDRVRIARLPQRGQEPEDIPCHCKVAKIGQVFTVQEVYRDDICIKECTCGGRMPSGKWGFVSSFFKLAQTACSNCDKFVDPGDTCCGQKIK